MSPLIRSLLALAALLAAAADSTTAQAAPNQTTLIIGDVFPFARPVLPPLHIHVNPPGGTVEVPDMCYKFGPGYKPVGLKIESRPDVPDAIVHIEPSKDSRLELFVIAPRGAELYITEYCELE